MKIKYSMILALSQLIALHGVARGYNKAVEQNTQEIVQSLVLVNALIFALLGLLLLLRGFRFQHALLQKSIELLIWCIIIAVASAFGNAVQNSMASDMGNSLIGILIGGAVGGLIAACGGGAIYIIGRLSPSQRLLLGISLLLLGFFVELTQIAFMLISLH